MRSALLNANFSLHMNVTGSVLVGVLFGLSLVATAQQHPVCGGMPLTEARSLDTLPPQLNSLLGRDRGGFEGIADRNGKFNVTDVVDSSLPMRRFVLGGLSASCAIVAVERGGRAHSYEVVAFEQIDTKWRVAQRWSINAAPRSLQELVTHGGK